MFYNDGLILVKGFEASMESETAIEFKLGYFLSESFCDIRNRCTYSCNLK